jgi:hypothetical protein
LETSIECLKDFWYNVNKDTIAELRKLGQERLTMLF